MSLLRRHDRRVDGTPPPLGRGRTPHCDFTEPISGTEECVRTRSGPVAPLRNGGMDREGISDAHFEQVFQEEYELRERELVLAQEKAYLARNLKHRLSLLLGDQEDEMRSVNSASSPGPSSRRLDGNRLDDYVIRRPAELVDGMNRISAYVGSGSGDFGGAYFPNTSHDVSIQSRDRSEVSTQRPLPPVMRVQPLHSPWPPNGTVLFAPQQPRLEQQEQRPIPRPVPHTNAGVQTDPTTEDAIAVKPLTIERDETLTKRVHSPEQTEPSVSSLCPPRPNGPASGEATLSGSVRSDSKPSPLAETRTDEERGAKPLEKTGASTPSNETRNTQQTVIAAENARTPKQQVYISPQPQLTSDAKGVIISSPVPIRVHLMPLSPPPESSAASATAAAAGRGLVGGAGATWESGYDDALRQGAVDHMLQFPPLTTPRTAAWYLPTSRVLEPAEFRNLLRGDWMPPPRSVQVAEATVDWSPPVTSRGISVSPTPIPTQEVEPTSPPPPVAPLAAAETAAMPSLHAELRDPAPRVEDYIVEFPPGPDLPVPDMPPPGTHRKSKCSCTCSRPCAPRCHFSRHFPFIKRGRKNKGGNTSGL